jgi:hypothetical protein
MLVLKVLILYAKYKHLHTSLMVEKMKKKRIQTCWALASFFSLWRKLMFDTVILNLKVMIHFYNHKFIQEKTMFS